MSILQQLVARAQQHPATITLCETDDPRVLQAAVKAQQSHIANIILIGDETKIRDSASNLKLDIAHIEIQNPKNSNHRELLFHTLLQKRGPKGMTPEQAEIALNDPLCFANMMVEANLADGSVAGAVYSTADVVRNALQLIGKKSEIPIVSSFFLMLLDKAHHPHQGGIIFSDCGLVIDPDAEQLAAIAVAASQSVKALLDEEPRIAMLSFSTAGSAKHPKVDKVVQAAKLVKQALPDVAIDEDVQFDTAIIPEVAHKKLKDSKVHGRSNVFIFPDLDAGNIGYKIAERLGGATAIGPLLQGLSKPANDLSRGCSIDDIYHVIAITTLQAQSA